MYPSPLTGRSSCALFIVAVCLLAAPAVRAQDPPEPPVKKQELPKAEDVLAANIKAIGGRKALEKHKSVVVVMKGTVVEQNMELTVEIKQKAPNLMRMKMSMQDVFEQETGFDGKVAWSKDPFTGERVLEDVERAQMVREAAFNAQLKWKQLYKKVETVGMKKVGDRECIVVQLTPEKGHPFKAYYDKETYLLLALEGTSESAMGEQTVRTLFSDYKEVGGVLYAYTHEMNVGPATIETKLEKIEWDVKLDDALFKKPWADKDEKKKDEKKKDGGDAGKSGQSS